MRRHSDFPSSGGGHGALEKTKTADLTVQERLELYTGVNKELKRLLVASVGQDLEQHIGQLVMDKAQLQLRFDRSLKQLAAYQEEVEQSIVEGDIWRSKFLASRVMMEEFSSWKTAIFAQYHACREALEVFLSERTQLHRNLSACRSILSSIGQSLKIDSFIKSNSSTESSTSFTMETQTTTGMCTNQYGYMYQPVWEPVQVWVC